MSKYERYKGNVTIASDLSTSIKTFQTPQIRVVREKSGDIMAMLPLPQTRYSQKDVSDVPNKKRKKSYTTAAAPKQQ